MSPPVVLVSNSNEGHRRAVQFNHIHDAGQYGSVERKNGRSVVVLKYSVAVLTAVIALSSISSAAQARSDEWFALPTEERITIEVIDFTPKMGRFQKFKVHAAHGPVYVESLQLTLAGEGTRTYRVDALIGRDRYSQAFDLPGRDAVIHRAEIRYKKDRTSDGVLQIIGLIADPPGGFEVLETVLLDTKDRAIKMRLDGGERPSAKIRLRAWGDTVIVKRADVVFRNGQRQRIRIRDRLKPGESTEVIDLLGYNRNIKFIALKLRPQRGRAGIARIDLLGKPAPRGYRRAVRRNPPINDWNLLGRRRAALFSKDSNVFRVGESEGRYTSIRVSARDQKVRMYGMTIVYGNGEREDVPFYGTLEAGETTPPYKLKGPRYIDYIKLQYRTRLNFRGPGEVELWGQPRLKRRR